MLWRDQCVVVIPCLNEAATIGPLVYQTKRFLPNVTVVDDGSHDDTYECAESAGARVLKHFKTEGKGAAMTTGFRSAVRAGFAWSLVMDGDGQHSPKDIPAFLDLAQSEQPAMIVGNRMVNPENMPLIRRLVNRWMSRQISELTGSSIADSQCGFRLIKMDAWASLPINARRFQIESELLVQFARAGHAIRFVPIEVIYKREQSKIHPVCDTIRWFRWWWQTRRALSSKSLEPVSPPVLRS